MTLARTPRTGGRRHAARRGRAAPVNRFLVAADFERRRLWANLGGGETISEALESARPDLVSEREVVRWNHAYSV